jgi:electron transfer flavoprotein beta subunit
MIAACLKWLESAEAISPADQAALELALRHGERSGQPVMAVTLGPAAARRAARDALASGAHHAVHVLTNGATPSRETAVALSAHLQQATTVWCGDASADRGSASVPSFLADLLGVQQALGVIAVELASTPITATRRLDGGRREVLHVTGPAVISVEGAAARPRRIGLRSQLIDRSADLITVAGPRPAHVEPPLVPYRPRPQQLAAPAGDTARERIGALLHGAAPTRRGELVELDPPAAAERILAALRGWGYLGPVTGE